MNRRGVCRPIYKAPLKGRIDVSSQARTILCDVKGLKDPTITSVETLARVQLLVRAAGYTMRLINVDSRLEELIELSGLSEILVSVPTAELRRQTE